MSLTREKIRAWQRKRLQEISSHSLNKEVTLLRQAFEYFAPDIPNPVGKFTYDYKPKTRFLTQEEARKLLAVASPQAQVWIMLALYTSAEPAAIRRMTWADINLETGWVHVRGTKYSKRDRFVPLHPELRTFLSALSKDAPLVCPWVNRHRDLKAWCTKANIEGCTMVDLRRTCVSWMKQAGVDSKAAADLAGHSTPAMVDRVYGQLNAPAYQEAIAQLPALSDGHKPGHKTKQDSENDK